MVSNPERRILPGPVGPQDVSFGPCSGTACAVKLVKNHAHAGLGGAASPPMVAPWEGAGRVVPARPCRAERSGPCLCTALAEQPSPTGSHVRDQHHGTCRVAYGGVCDRTQPRSGGGGPQAVAEHGETRLPGRGDDGAGR